jgi:hypothetical protein
MAVEPQPLSFLSDGFEIAGCLRVPSRARPGTPGIVFTGPLTSIKEQVAGTHAAAIPPLREVSAERSQGCWGPWGGRDGAPPPLASTQRSSTKRAIMPSPSAEVATAVFISPCSASKMTRPRMPSPSRHARISTTIVVRDSPASLSMPGIGFTSDSTSPSLAPLCRPSVNEPSTPVARSLPEVDSPVHDAATPTIRC